MQVQQHIGRSNVEQSLHRGGSIMESWNGVFGVGTASYFCKAIMKDY